MKKIKTNAIQKHPLNNPPNWEGHITLSKQLIKKQPLIVEQLLSNRLVDSENADHFVTIVNVDQNLELENLSRSAGATGFTSPIKTGHDLFEADILLTTKAANYSDIRDQLHNILIMIESVVGITKSEHPLYNFEIERKLSKHRKRTKLNLEKIFLGYQTIPDNERPFCETHVGYHESDLLPYEDIIVRLAQHIAYIPNQIIGLSETLSSEYSDKVVSFYHSDFESALKFNRLLRSAKDQIGASYIICEEVVGVAVPKNR